MNLWGVYIIMNRANFGNVVTNGMQVLSVGATTGAKVLGAANKTLNNQDEAMRQAKLDNITAKTDNIKLKNESLKQKQQTTSIDDLMGSAYKDNSGQIQDIKTKLYNDNAFLKDWRKSLDDLEPLNKLIKDVTGGDNNADV